MSVLTASDEFSPVFQIETTTPVKGGAVVGDLDAPTDGECNAQAQSLANQALFLYNRLSPIGSVTMFGGSSAPTGWLLCHGQAVSRTTYDQLFAAIGTNFGEGNGTTTFNLPDMRGQFARGVDSGAGVDPDAGSRIASGTNGNTGDQVGSKQGDAFESHTHDVDGSQSGGLDTDIVASALSDGSVNASTNATGGSTETRPTNLGLNFIIRVDYDQQ